MHYLGALQDMYGGQEDRNRMVQQRQAYADELKLQMQEKQRAKQREALKLKALEQKEWELELAAMKHEIRVKHGRRRKEDIGVEQQAPSAAHHSPTRIHSQPSYSSFVNGQKSARKQETRHGQLKLLDRLADDLEVQMNKKYRVRDEPKTEPEATGLPWFEESRKGRKGVEGEGEALLRPAKVDVPWAVQRPPLEPEIPDIYVSPEDDSALGNLSRARKGLFVEYQLLGGDLTSLKGKAVFSNVKAMPQVSSPRPFAPTSRPEARHQKGLGRDEVHQNQVDSTMVYPPLVDGDFRDHTHEWTARNRGSQLDPTNILQKRPLSRMWNRGDLEHDELDKWLSGYVAKDSPMVKQGEALEENLRLESPNPLLESESTFLMPA